MPVLPNDKCNQDFVDSITKHGQYNFGDGLFLDVKTSGGYYSFHYNGRDIGERPRERVALGSTKNMLLKTARLEALKLDEVLQSGGSPKVHWATLKTHKTNPGITFAEAIDAYYAHGKDWLWKAKGSMLIINTVVKNYLRPAACANLPLAAITHLHVRDILAKRTLPYQRSHSQPVGEEGPLWRVKPQIGRRAQCYIYAMIEHQRSLLNFKGENPASMRKTSGLARLLGKTPKSESHKDLPVDEVPPLYAALCAPKQTTSYFTVSQAAEATGRNPIALVNAIKRGKFEGVIKAQGELRHNTANLIPVSELEKAGLTILRQPPMTADEYLYSNILRMIMLTLARSDMVCKLKWDEIKPKWQNSVQGVILWDKHKNDRFGYKSGTVIIDEIRAILDVMDERRRRERIESDYVFPHGPTKVGMDRWLNQPTNPNTMEQRLRRYLAQNEAITTKDATVHGMRTAFSTWAVDVREYDWDLAMITIGHKIKGTEADLIYLRNVRKLSKRHEMMTEWAKFCRSQIKVAQQQTHVVQTNVVPLIRPE